MGGEEATTTQQTKTEAIPASPAESGAEMLSQDTEPKATYDFGGLFSDEAKPSEEELSGEEKKAEPSEKKEEGKPKEEPKSDTATPKPEGDKPKEEPKKEVKEEEPKKKEPDKKPDKPPEGFVPKEALAEARKQLRDLKEEVARLKAQPPPEEKAKPQPAPDEKQWENFKVLSDQEYDQLVEDDPIEAQKYFHRLRKYERFQDQKERAKAEQEQSKAKFNNLVSETVKQIQEAVPGIYDQESEVASQLATFAVEHGFDDERYLDAMTNPATLIVPPGQQKSFILGPGAASLIKLLHNLRAKVAEASDPAKLKEEITKEIEPKLRETITQELVAKFKDAGTGKFKSLTEVPGSGEKPEPTSKSRTEEEWAKLSEEEREKILMAT